MSWASLLEALDLLDLDLWKSEPENWNMAHCRPQDQHLPTKDTETRDVRGLLQYSPTWMFARLVKCSKLGKEIC